MTPIQASALLGALGLAAQGLPCFPCRQGSKRPTLQGSFYNATTDARELSALWERGPGELIGVPCGIRTMFDVLDVDLVKHPDAAGAWWRENEPSIPRTRVHRTQSGGLHLFFVHRPGLKNQAKVVVNGIDTRTTGGYCIWWPTCGGKVISGADIAPWPEHLFKLLAKPEPEPPPRKHTHPSANDSSNRRYALAALRSAFKKVAQAREGCRNHTLNVETFSLSRFIPNSLDVGEVRDAMFAAARHAGLSELETNATIRSALSGRRAAA